MSDKKYTRPRHKNEFNLEFNDWGIRKDHRRKDRRQKKIEEKRVRDWRVSEDWD